MSNTDSKGLIKNTHLCLEAIKPFKRKSNTLLGKYFSIKIDLIFVTSFKNWHRNRILHFSFSKKKTTYKEEKYTQYHILYQYFTFAPFLFIVNEIKNWRQSKQELCKLNHFSHLWFCRVIWWYHTFSDFLFCFHIPFHFRFVISLKLTNCL